MGLRRPRAPCPRVGTPQYVSWARSGVYHPCRCAAASTGEEIEERSGALVLDRYQYIYPCHHSSCLRIYPLINHSSSPTYVRPVRGCCRCRGAVRASAPARLPRLLPAGRPRRTGRRGTRRCASTETRRRARTHVRARPGKLPR